MGRITSVQTAMFAVSLIVLLAVIVKAYSSDGQIEQTTRDEHTEQFTELETPLLTMLSSL